MPTPETRPAVVVRCDWCGEPFADDAPLYTKGYLWLCIEGYLWLCAICHGEFREMAAFMEMEDDDDDDET